MTCIIKPFWGSTSKVMKLGYFLDVAVTLVAFLKSHIWILTCLIIITVTAAWTHCILYVQSNISAETAVLGNLRNSERTFEQMQDQLPKRRVYSIDCRKAFEGDKVEIEKGKIPMSPMKHILMSDDHIHKEALHCDRLKAKGYILHSMSPEEEAFPIAFSIFMYKDVARVERLLRLIYRPQNIYCIHIDMKSPVSIHKAMQAVADCFDNVFIASRLEYIIYGGWSRLQAEFNCMEEALKRNKAWKYYINMPSEVFPLRTNAELVKILKLFNGTNDVESTKPDVERYIVSHHPVFKQYSDGSLHAYINMTQIPKAVPPHNTTIVKGSAYAVLSRQFVEFVTSPSDIMKDFLEWSKTTYSPDEHVFATLNNRRYNPSFNAPGGSYSKCKLN